MDQRLGRESRTVVAYRETGRIAVVRRFELGMRGGEIDRIMKDSGKSALEAAGIAGDECGSPVTEIETPRCPAAPAKRSASSAASAAEIERLEVQPRRIRAGGKQQRIDDCVDAFDFRDDRLQRELVLRALGITFERRVRFGADDRERRAQLVRRIGRESPLACKCRFQPIEHSIEGRPQSPEFIFTPVAYTARKIVRFDLGCKIAECIERGERASCQRSGGRQPAAGKPCGKRDRNKRVAIDVVDDCASSHTHACRRHVPRATGRQATAQTLAAPSQRLDAA